MRGVTLRLYHLIYPYTISTHTPHARRDGEDNVVLQVEREFLLTRLMRGVTYPLQNCLW